MKQTFPWEGKNRSDIEEIPFILYNPKIHHCVHMSLPLDLILSASPLLKIENTAHILTFSFLVYQVVASFKIFQLKYMHILYFIRSICPTNLRASENTSEVNMNVIQSRIYFDSPISICQIIPAVSFTTLVSWRKRFLISPFKHYSDQFNKER
jgi:hypothetical protein